MSKYTSQLGSDLLQTLRVIGECEKPSKAIVVDYVTTVKKIRNLNVSGKSKSMVSCSKLNKSLQRMYDAKNADNLIT